MKKVVAVWLVCAICLAAIVGLHSYVVQPLQQRQVERAGESQSPLLASPPPPRQLDVTGAPGVKLLLEPDGSSYLIYTDGRREQVTAKQPEPRLDSEQLAAKVMQKLEQPRHVDKGDLIVFNDRVVLVPHGAVVTGLTKTKLVIINTDGSVTTYLADGSVTRRVKEMARHTDASPAP